MPIKTGLFGYVKHRFKGIAIPFIIGEVFVLIYSFTSDFSYNFLFGYLWYVRDLFLAMSGIFLLKKLVKNEKLFYFILLLTSVICMFGLIWIPMLSWPKGPFRSIISIPIGMFAALIPPVKTESREKITKLIIAILFVIIFLCCLVITSLPDKGEVLPYVLVIICYPALIYFANQINCHSRFLNWLGSLSFPIYAFQCIVRVIEAFGLTDNTVLFCILIGLVLIYSFLTEFFKAKNCKKAV